MNATYFLSGQREGVSIYYEDIANKSFMDLGRLLDKNKDQGETPGLMQTTNHKLATVQSSRGMLVHFTFGSQHMWLLFMKQSACA